MTPVAMHVDNSLGDVLRRADEQTTSGGCVLVVTGPAWRQETALLPHGLHELVPVGPPTVAGRRVRVRDEPWRAEHDCDPLRSIAEFRRGATIEICEGCPAAGASAQHAEGHGKSQLCGAYRGSRV